jgi:calcineurin-like phosphoesterase family protein
MNLMGTSEIASDVPRDIPIPQWVVSDTHFGHENILTYCPWRKTWATTVQEHDAALIAAWRACVRPDDWVLHLGDVALGPKGHAAIIRKQLTGRIVVVRGNHDRSLSVMRAAGYDVVCSAVRIVLGDEQWIGRHNPAAFSVREANASKRLLHGHCHGNELSTTIHEMIRARTRDCSLDALRSVAPVSWSLVT